MKNAEDVVEATDTKNPREQPTATGSDLIELNESLALRAKAMKYSDDKLSSLEAENLALKNAITELNEELASKENENAKLSKKESIKVGKDTYELAIKKCVYMRNGVRVEITKAVLDSDPALAKELVEKNNGVLIKKVGN